MLYKRGNVWWCEHIIDGKRYRFSCKTNDKTLAEEVSSTIKSDIIRKRFSIPEKYKKYHNFQNTWKEYLKSLNNSQKTIDRKIISSKHFLPFFKDKFIEDITNSEIKGYELFRKKEVESMDKNKVKRESEISFRSVNIDITILQSFFNYCIEKEYIDKNPCGKIKKLNELKRIKTLSDKDIEKLIAGATNKLTKDLITFLIYTGCRKGEALNLKWDDVDMQNSVIAIKGTKTKLDRYIPISNALKGILSGIEKNHGSLYVFNRNGTKLTDFKRSFHTACKNAGLKDLRIHDLRHVFASKMVMNGTSLYITGELLGHKTTQMTKRYSHLVPETLKKAVDEVFRK